MAGENPADNNVLAHIVSIASRTRRDSDLLAELLRYRAWPSGSADRSEPGALPWLRQWSPTGPVPIMVACGCSDGRCLVCN